MLKIFTGNKLSQKLLKGHINPKTTLNFTKSYFGRMGLHHKVHKNILITKIRITEFKLCQKSSNKHI